MKFDRITVNPAKMNGQPCIRDMRLAVGGVVELAATYSDRAEVVSGISGTGRGRYSSGRQFQKNKNFFSGKVKDMQEYAVHLTDREFRLFQLIRQMGNTKERKENLIDTVIRQIKIFSETEKYREKKKWLQTGDKSFFQSVRPVRPEKDSPPASDIILEHRKHLA